MRKINKIIIHCADTPEGRNVSAGEIRRWHMQDNKWTDVGYHYIVELDGSIVAGRKVAVQGAHVAGHNHDSIGVCYVGGRGKDGKAKDTRTDAQKKSIRDIVTVLKNIWPDAAVKGHRDFANKECPSFDVSQEL